MNYICPVPWNFMATRSNGDFRVCCQCNISPDQGIIRTDRGLPMNAASTPIDQARNSQIQKRIRKNMMAGIWDQSCLRCKKEEKAGLRSRRMEEVKHHSIDIDKIKSHTHQNGAIDTKKFPLFHFDLRFGNLCNLACRMCGPTDSSSWYGDWVRLNNTTSFDDSNGEVKLELKGNKYITKHYDWHQRDFFWEQLVGQINNISYIYMAGGEPLLIAKHYDFLDFCVKEKHSANITLEYITNCTKIPDRALSLWAHFKEVRIGASIDGYGPHIEYQRFPIKWNDVFLNLKSINSMPNNIFSWFSYTVTAYNILHISDFIKWKLVESNLNSISKSRRNPILNHNFAHKPNYLNIRVLPMEIKSRVNNSFKELISWATEYGFEDYIIERIRYITSSLSNYMMNENYYDEYWKEFCDKTEKLDLIRRQNFLQLEPVFENYFL